MRPWTSLLSTRGRASGFLAAGVLIGTLSLVSAASSAMADQGSPGSACRGEPVDAACLEVRAREKSALYGVLPIEEHRTAGDQMRRIFSFDSSGSDLLLIDLIRRPGVQPTISVHFPRRVGEGRPNPFSVVMPEEVWENLSRSHHFGRESAPAPEPENSSINICLDGGTYLLETIEPAPRQGDPATIRRTIEHTCKLGPVARYAAEVERTALTLNPDCERVATRHYPSPVLRLFACRILQGDRAAAADVLNLAQAFRTNHGPGDTLRVATILADRSIIDWNGERHENRDNAAAFWAEHAAPIVGVTTFHIRSVDGQNSDRVRLLGTLMRTVHTPLGRASGSEVAAVELIWTRRHGTFEVERATVGPWEPFPPRRDSSTETNRDRRRR